MTLTGSVRSAICMLLTSMCQFGHAEAHYLGHIIGQGKVEPDDKKVTAVLKYPTPTCKKDVQAFWGLGYCRHFIDHFVTIITPLTLPRSGNQIRSAGLQNLRRLFCTIEGSNPVLMVADPTKPFRLMLPILGSVPF